MMVLIAVSSQLQRASVVNTLSVQVVVNLLLCNFILIYNFILIVMKYE